MSLQPPQRRSLGTIVLAAPSLLFLLAAAALMLMGATRRQTVMLAALTAGGDNGQRKSHDKVRLTTRTALADLRRRVEDLEQRLAAAGHGGANATALSCRDLMRRPNSPFREGEFLTDASTPYRWRPRPDGSREFDLDSAGAAPCALHRYSAQEARRCLAGKHISMIGCSVTRFQYMSLAYLVENGRYPPRFVDADAEQQGQSSNNVCQEPGPKGPFFDWLGGGKDGGPYNGRMECSCNRDMVPNVEGWTCNRTHCSSEHFMYASAPDPPTGGNQRVLMSYFGEFGWGDAPRPIMGFEFAGCSYNGTCRRDDSVLGAIRDRMARDDYDFDEPLEDALDPEKGGFLTRIAPPVDIAVYNRGVWGQLPVERAEKVLGLLRNWVTRSSSSPSGNNNGRDGRCIFKTTASSSRSVANEHDQTVLRQAAYDASCSVFNLAHVTKDFGRLFVDRPGRYNPAVATERDSVYSDTVHFKPWVYEELNNLLLNYLCNADGP